MADNLAKRGIDYEKTNNGDGSFACYAHNRGSYTLTGGY